jgi:hypothetical protein
LQETLGISYKDAAHRLFMVEVERVKKADAAAKAFAAVRRQIDDLINQDISLLIRGSSMIMSLEMENGSPRNRSCIRNVVVLYQVPDLAE